MSRAQAWNDAEKSRFVLLTERAKGQTEAVRHRGLDYPDDCHLQSRRPPGADRDKRFERTDRKVGDDADRECSDDCGNAAHKEERDNRNERADGGGKCG